MRILLLSPLLLTAACGDSEPEMTFATTIQWSPQIECAAGEAALGLNMRAILDIGGHEPCDLEVNSTTLEVSGECQRITIGIVRPLGLGYWYPNPGNDNLEALAYVIGWVDLGKETLDNRSNVEVPLNADGISSEQVDTNDEITALPQEDDCAGLVDDNERHLCTAKAWARDRLTERLTNFDIDSDTESNLAEACANTLFD